MLIFCLGVPTHLGAGLKFQLNKVICFFPRQVLGYGELTHDYSGVVDYVFQILFH